ncbi:MAG: hypothetical protein KDB69_03310 [Acidimicrobiia bacterium]|nr:hypothetical protein [Acidimicrobiia bacterium]
MTVFIAVLIGLALVAGTMWTIKFIMAGPPPEPNPDAVEEVDVPYLCTVCGLSLTVTEAQVGEEIEPPRHCREEMVRAV